MDIDYYVDRLIAQYRDQPKARATVGIYVKQILVDGLCDELQNGFTLSTAVGPQLDIIGKYVGLTRYLGIPADPPYFGFQDSTTYSTTDGNLNGFTSSTDAGVNAQAIFYQTNFAFVVNTALSDDAYRFMIVLKIALNSIDGTLASIQEFIHTYLEGFVQVVDNADMTMVYGVSSRMPFVAPEVLEAYLPRPMGVGVTFSGFPEAAVSPTSVSKTNTDGPSTPPYLQTVTTTTPIVVTPSGGTAPYTYQWQQISTPPAAIFIDPLWVSSGATANNALFQCHFTNHAPPNKTWVSEWRCLVTDANGLTAVTDTVTVTHNYNAAP